MPARSCWRGARTTAWTTSSDWRRTRGSSRRSAGNWPTPRAESARHGRPARRFAEFPYATLTSWSRRRRVVAKAEHLPGKANPRFVVTSLPAATFSARTVYERVYCPRGDMENTIKEQQLDLFSDRTSASRFAANQLRLLFASVLFDALRRMLAGARITVSVRRVRVAMDSSHPSAAAFAHLHARLEGNLPSSPGLPLTPRRGIAAPQDRPEASQSPESPSARLPLHVRKTLRSFGRGPTLQSRPGYCPQVATLVPCDKCGLAPRPEFRQRSVVLWATGEGFE